MRVLIVMLSRIRGGVEQSALDQARALTAEGHEVLSVIDSEAAFLKEFQSYGMKIAPIRHVSWWDARAVWKLWRRVRAFQPDVVITHGKRALGFARWAARDIPIVATAHNYQLKPFRSAYAAMAPTQDLLAAVALLARLPKERIYHVPNMIELHALSARTEHRPLVIGTMGRMIPKKGFEVFIRALALLKERGLEFRAVLGGEGEESARLKREIVQSGLEVELPGWISDKQAFWNGIDIFCLPSHHEPFGIVLLEAMAQGLPSVATASEGPVEILTHETDGLITPLGNAEALAHALERLLKDGEMRQRLGAHARRTVEERYALPVIGKNIAGVLETVVRSYTSNL